MREGAEGGKFCGLQEKNACSIRPLNYEEGFEMWHCIYASLQMLAAPVDTEK